MKWMRVPWAWTDPLVQPKQWNREMRLVRGTLGAYTGQGLIQQ